MQTIKTVIIHNFIVKVTTFNSQESNVWQMNIYNAYTDMYAFEVHCNPDMQYININNISTEALYITVNYISLKTQLKILGNQVCTICEPICEQNVKLCFGGTVTEAYII